MTTIDLIPLSSILTDRGTQARAAIDNDTVAEYAEAYEGGMELPPLVLFRVGPDLILADGFHRLAGARRAKQEMVNCEVRDGTLRDAILYAAGCNESHGLRRTTADKARAVLMLLADKEWSERSDRWIAETCKVGPHFVANVRVAGSSTARAHSSSQKPRKGKDGKTRKPRKKKEKPAEKGTQGNEQGAGEEAVICPMCKGSGHVPKKKAERAAFQPPTAEQVKAYCQERKNSVDPDTFVDFYSSKGWKVGNASMKDWKASVRTWEKNRENGNGHARAGKTAQRQNDRFTGPGQPIED